MRETKQKLEEIKILLEEAEELLIDLEYPILQGLVKYNNDYHNDYTATIDIIEDALKKLKEVIKTLEEKKNERTNL